MAKVYKETNLEQMTQVEPRTQVKKGMTVEKGTNTKKGKKFYKDNKFEKPNNTNMVILVIFSTGVVIIGIIIIIKTSSKTKEENPSETIEERRNNNGKPSKDIKKEERHEDIEEKIKKADKINRLNADRNTSLKLFFENILHIKYDDKEFIYQEQDLSFVEKDLEKNVKEYLEKDLENILDKNNIWKLREGGIRYYIKYPNEQIKKLNLLNNELSSYHDNIKYDSLRKSICLSLRKETIKKDNFNKFCVKNDLDIKIDEINDIKIFLLNHENKHLLPHDGLNNQIEIDSTIGNKTFKEILSYVLILRCLKL